MLVILGKHWDFLWCVMYWVLWINWVAERYRLMAWIYWGFGEVNVWFLVVYGRDFVDLEWGMIGKDWDFTIRWSIRWESGGWRELIVNYWERWWFIGEWVIFQLVWRWTCLCCRAKPGSAPGWKVPPSLIFHGL